MIESSDNIRSLDDLRAFVHKTLCEKENLLAEQFSMTEMRLTRRSRECGLQFSLQGPRSLRLGAIWASDHNSIYFYDARGVRYQKLRLRHRLLPHKASDRWTRIGEGSGMPARKPKSADAFLDTAS